jgi:hypothetical protein
MHSSIQLHITACVCAHVANVSTNLSHHLTFHCILAMTAPSADSQTIKKGKNHMARAWESIMARKAPHT